MVRVCVWYVSFEKLLNGKLEKYNFYKVTLLETRLTMYYVDVIEIKTIYLCFVIFDVSSFKNPRFTSEKYDRLNAL